MNTRNEYTRIFRFISTHHIANYNTYAPFFCRVIIKRNFTTKGRNNIINFVNGMKQSDTMNYCNLKDIF